LYGDDVPEPYDEPNDIGANSDEPTGPEIMVVIQGSGGKYKQYFPEHHLKLKYD
jgi:hypothetical protein